MQPGPVGAVYVIAQSAYFLLLALFRKSRVDVVGQLLGVADHFAGYYLYHLWASSLFPLEIPG